MGGGYGRGGYGMEGGEMGMGGGAVGTAGVMAEATAAATARCDEPTPAEDNPFD